MLLMLWLGPSPSYLVNELQDECGYEALGSACNQKPLKALHLFSIESLLPAPENHA